MLIDTVARHFLCPHPFEEDQFHHVHPQLRQKCDGLPVTIARDYPVAMAVENPDL